MDKASDYQLRGIKLPQSVEAKISRFAAMWIGSTKNNKTKPFGIESYQEPVRSLGVNLSYNQDKNNNLNFFVKIYKMDTKLNIWQTRDLTLYGRTLLINTLGISKTVSAASVPCGCS